MKDSKGEGGTVLNLNLKDKAKGRWSGNAKLGEAHQVSGKKNCLRPSFLLLTKPLLL